VDSLYIELSRHKDICSRNGIPRDQGPLGWVFVGLGHGGQNKENEKVRYINITYTNNSFTSIETGVFRIFSFKFNGTVCRNNISINIKN